MNVNDLFPSKYLKAHDLGGKQFTLTIRAATLEELGYGNEKEMKLALAFEKASKLMLLNRTNAMIIASMYGPETDGWIGKAVTVYSARVKAFGAWHDALRIKEQVPARNVGAAKMPEAMVEAPPLDDEEDLLDVDEGNPLATSTDDNLWEPDTGPERATEEQLARLNELGEAYYVSTWQQVKERNVKRISSGKAQKAGELTPEQAQKLIDGIAGLMNSKATNGAQGAPAK